MSGVQSGSRLEQLQAVQARARLHRAHARWAGRITDHDRLDRLVNALTFAIRVEETLTRARPEVAAAVRAADTTVQDRLLQLGVTALQVKQWGVEQGLLPAVVRGRVSGLLVEAYATAHQHQETTP